MPCRQWEPFGASGRSVLCGRPLGQGMVSDEARGTWGFARRVFHPKLRCWIYWEGRRELENAGDNAGQDRFRSV